METTVEPVSIRIALDSHIPAYRQIVDATRTHLIAESLKPGDALPPVRQLAMDLGVHFNTVAEAYRLLAEEGWLELKRGRGARVLDRGVPKKASAKDSKAFSQRLNEIVAEALSRGVPKQQISRDLGLAATAVGHSEA